MILFNKALPDSNGHIGIAVDSEDNHTVSMSIGTRTYALEPEDALALGDYLTVASAIAEHFEDET